MTRSKSGKLCNVPSPTISVIVVRSASSTETMAGSSALLIICKSEYLSKPAVWFKALTGSSQVSWEISDFNE